MSELTLGQKLKFFRKEKEMSQSELELKSELEFGVISRIENGKVNPTKETIIKIVNNLDLNDKDLNYLLTLKNSRPTKEDVEKIVKMVQPELNEETFPAYIMDNRFRVWAYNQSILEVFGFTEKEARKGLGSNVIEITFTMFKVFKKIPKKYLFTVLKDQLAIYKQEAGRYAAEEYTKGLFKSLNQDALFEKLWNERPATRESFRTSRYYLKYKGKVLKILITRSTIPVDERFFLVEYFPQDKLTAEVFEKISEKINGNNN